MSAIRDLKTLYKILSELELQLYQLSFSFFDEKARKKAAEEEGRMLRDKINKELIKKTNEYIDNVYKDFPKPFYWGRCLYSFETDCCHDSRAEEGKLCSSYSPN